MGQIIGITGGIASGKSTLAELLAHCEPDCARYESGQLIAELAEDFNRALSGELAFETTHNDIELVNQTLIWFVEAISDKLHQEVGWNQLAITKHHMVAHPELFAKLIQYVDMTKKCPRLLDAHINATNKELYRPLLQWLGAYLVAKVSPTIWYDEIFRRIDLHDSDRRLVLINGLRYPSDALTVEQHGGVVIEIDRPLDQRDLTDPTEAHRAQIEASITVHNNGTLGQLESAAEQLWQDLTVGKPKKTYTAA